MSSQRIKVFQFFIYISFISLASGLFRTQIWQADYYKSLSLKNTIRLIPIEAARGKIFDRNGVAIAVSDLSFDLVVIPQEVDDIHSLMDNLSKISGIPKKSLFRTYGRNYRLPFAPVRVAANLQRKKAFYIEERLASVPGALIHATPIRSYPNGKVGSHVIGYVGKIQREDFIRLKDYGYKMRDLVGKSGIEKYYDAYLKGESGGVQIEVDAKSREVRRLGFKEAHKGKDLQLTIDLGLQRFVDELFKGKRGSCIVMDTETGEILALVSSPEIDPNIFTSGSDDERVRLLQDRRRPFINRAISSAYPPGSTFKIIMAVAGIASDAIKRNTQFDCGGIFNLGRASFRCWKESGHGSEDIVEALIHSCNIFFYNLGKRLGAAQIRNYSLQFGLGAPTGIDLPGEKKGVVPGPLWKRLSLKERWYEGDTINYSIGQGYLLVTPIQMLRAAAIIANGGYCPTPYLVERIGDKPLAKRRPYVARLKQSSFNIVREGMFGVVNDGEGTGQNALAKGIKIAGKTGTAQSGTPGDTHAWFVGYMPADNPKINFVVFLEHGGKGGRHPAHMARIIATYLRENGFLN